MCMGMSASTLMRHVDDGPHNPFSFQGHCHWHNMHTHTRPHRGGIGSRCFLWGTAQHGFFPALIYFFVNTFCTFG